MRSELSQTGGRPGLISAERSSGFSLVEVLVTLMIFSIGLSGYAAMQTQALRESVDSQQRSVAIWRSQELIDRIRANRDATDTYVAGLETGGAGRFNCTVAPSACGATASADAASCSATEMANYDIYEVMCGTTDKATDSLIGLNTALACVDSDIADAACSPGSDLVLTMEWTSQAARADKFTTDTAEVAVSSEPDTTLDPSEVTIPETELPPEESEVETVTVDLLTQSLSTSFRP